MDIVNNYGYSNNEINAPVDFVSNGNLIPIDKENIIKYIHDVLSDYDEKKKNGSVSYDQTNPYHDKIVMPINDGKYISVPDDIQHIAVQSWLDMNAQNKVNQNENSIGDSTNVGNVVVVDDDDVDDIDIKYDQHGPYEITASDKKIKKNIKSKSNYFWLFAFILIFILVLYFFKTNGISDRNYNNNMNYKNNMNYQNINDYF